MLTTEFSLFITRAICFLLALFCFGMVVYLRRQEKKPPLPTMPAKEEGSNGSYLQSQLIALNQKLTRELFESRVMLSLWKEAQTLEPKQFLSVMLEQLLQGLNFSFGCIIVRSVDQPFPEVVLARVEIDEETGRASIVPNLKDRSDRTQWTHTVSKELEQYLLMSDNRALKSTDLMEDSIEAPIEPGGKVKPLHLLSIGIKQGSMLLGSIHLISDRERFSLEPWQHDLLISLASQTRLILENRSLQHYVRIDSLTSLFNRGHFDNKLREESLRHSRSGQPFSLIMVDVDHFKKINDQYGHQTGDEVLVALANTLKKTFRGSDTICRYGGEEIAVILTETNRQGAVIAAENAQKALQEMHVKDGEGKVIQVTVSMGIASFPEDSDNQHELLRKADRRLYLAKEAGRDRFISQD